MVEPETDPPGRRELRRLELRARVVEQAELLFLEKGYDGTKVTDVCERAGVSYGTFFNHFSEKRDLLRELAEASLRILAEHLEQLSKEAGPLEDQLLFLFEGGSDGFDPARRELQGQLWSVSVTDAPEDRDRRFHAAFESFLAEGVARGRVRDDVPVETLAEIVGSTLSTMALSWVHFDDYPFHERAVAAARFLAGALEPQRRTPRRRRSAELDDGKAVQEGRS